MPKPEPVKNLRNYALWLLGQREYTRAELKSKLTTRAADPAEVAPLLAELEGQGLLSEARFVESRVRYLALSQGKGPQYIRQALKAKGADPALIETSLASEDYDWYDLARRARQRKFGDAGPTDFKSRMKQQQHLAGRGFSYEQIRHAFDTDQAP